MYTRVGTNEITTTNPRDTERVRSRTAVVWFTRVKNVPGARTATARSALNTVMQPSTMSKLWA